MTSAEPGFQIEQYLDRELQTPDRFTVLWHNGESISGVYVPADIGRFILAEDSIYEPMGSDYAFVDEDSSAPFLTRGNQWLINLDSRGFAERSIYYTEGEIQGLVYAIDAMSNGGVLRNKEYQAVIERWVKGWAREITAWSELDEKTVAKLTALRFCFSRSVITQPVESTP